MPASSGRDHWKSSTDSKENIKTGAPSYAQEGGGGRWRSLLFPAPRHRACSASSATCCSYLAPSWLVLPDSSAESTNPSLRMKLVKFHNWTWHQDSHALSGGQSSPALPARSLPSTASTSLRFLRTGPRCLEAQDAAKTARVAFSLEGLRRTGETKLGSLNVKPVSLPLQLSLGNAAAGKVHGD